MEEQKEEDEGAEDDGGSNRGIRRKGRREGGREGGRKRGRLGGRDGRKDGWSKEIRDGRRKKGRPPPSLPLLLASCHLSSLHSSLSFHCSLHSFYSLFRPPLLFPFFSSSLTPSPPCSLLPPLLTGVNLVFTLYRQTMEYAI